MTNSNAIINFCYWVHNFNGDFIQKVWGGTHLEQHLTDKFRGMIARNGRGYADSKSVMDFIMELDNDHKRELMDYINENYDAGFGLKG